MPAATYYSNPAYTAPEVKYSAPTYASCSDAYSAPNYYTTTYATPYYKAAAQYNPPAR